MKSRNFEFLRAGVAGTCCPRWLCRGICSRRSGKRAGETAPFAENLTKDIYRDLGLPKPDQADLCRSADQPVVCRDHAEGGSRQASCSPHSRQQGRPRRTRDTRGTRSGFSRRLSISHAGCSFNLGKGMPRASLPFEQPSADGSDDSKGQLKREKRQVLEKLAAQEAQMEALLRDLEAARQAAATAEKNAEEIQALAPPARRPQTCWSSTRRQRARALSTAFSRQLGGMSPWAKRARRKSAKKLRSSINRPRPASATPTTSCGTTTAIRWPSSRRRKHRSIPSADGSRRNSMPMGLRKMHGHRPVIFYTNGYDIWMWDDALGYPPRKVFGYYSKDSLQYLVNFQRAASKPLNSLEPNEAIVNRLYQIEAIKRVSDVSQTATAKRSSFRRREQAKRASRSHLPICSFGPDGSSASSSFAIAANSGSKPRTHLATFCRSPFASSVRG